MSKTLPKPEVCADELERFAQALTGVAGAFAVDAILDRTLAALEPSDLEFPGASLKEVLYRRIVKMNRRRALYAPRGGDAPPATPLRRAGDLALALDRLPLDEKEALLLIALGRFTYENAARILELDKARFIGRLARAREKLGRWRANHRPLRRPPYLRIVK